MKGWGVALAEVALEKMIAEDIKWLEAMMALTRGRIGRYYWKA
jgi:hypothetical protein